MDPQDLDRLNELLEQDVEIREKIKEQVAELDKKTRNMAGVLNRIHSTPTESSQVTWLSCRFIRLIRLPIVPVLIDSVRPILQSCQDTSAAMAALIPLNQFWRFKEMWSSSLRTAVYSAAFVEYLSSGKLISLPDVAKILGKEEWKDRFSLAVEDYLHGLISLVNELSRLAVNAVTLGNFEEPIRISIFVKELFAGFTMLNLKNDTLRRRFDSLKYDIKKIEEVVYDLSLRKLAAPKKEQVDSKE
ncbi:Translin [Leucogyrophana mollusca]|uniref:Translin n=1 Tax=Leucogyrophana mollusca TaxID=85980 RepID=A0ACB8BTB2_9AGAM|nr:Translin [Leucogyrophana mollusca]